MKKLGKLEQVDLHEIWSGETSDFTKWLSQEENIAELGHATGIELKVLEHEQKTGLFKSDILCKDVLTDHYVVIGNQLDRTDHNHLGQLLTIAAELEDVTLIWIARTFTREHLAALIWLNKITDESTRFFGIEIEIYKIEDSLPATRFNIVVKPNDLNSVVNRSATAQKLSDLEFLQLEYWHGLKNFMEENNSFVRLLGTPPKSWFDAATDRGKYFLSVALNSQDNSLNISLTIIGEKAKDDFEKLYRIAYKDSLVEVNKDLIWYKLQANVRSAVTLKAYADFTEKEDWTNQFAWFKDNLERFDKYFRPKIKQLY